MSSSTYFCIFYFIEKTKSYFLSFYNDITLVPIPSSPHIPPPTSLFIHSSERLRCIALRKDQGPPHYIEAEQGICPKRMGSQKATTSSRDKSWCQHQWLLSLSQPCNCHPHSECLVWSYAGVFPVRLELVSFH